MKKYVNGKIIEMTEQEIKAMENQDKLYWTNMDYDEAVNIEIRKKYSVSQEFAILRQKEEKPEEYQEYYNYCEECKTYVKEMKNNTK